MSDPVAKIRLALEGSPAVIAGIQQVEKQFSSLKGMLPTLGAGLTVGGLAAFVKGGLDAIDAMDELSERTGLAVKDIAGLQIAYKLAGMDGDALERSMGKLNKSMAEGNDAFAAMGVSVKNADGTLRDAREVLGDVADKFKGYQDGAAKAALAQEIFGKSGAEMLGVLNQGSEGLAEFDAMASRLGLTVSDEAAKSAAQFNDTLDLLGLGLQGTARQIAANFAPTLSTMAGELLKNANDTNSLNIVSNVLGGTLKGLYTIAATGVQIFVNVGRSIGAVGAAISAILRGDFADAKSIMEESRVDNAEAWNSTVEGIKRVWSDAGNAGVQAMAAMGTQTNKTAPIVAKGGKTAKETATAFDGLIKKLQERLDASREELTVGRALTDMEKLEVKTRTDLTVAGSKLTATQKAAVLAKLEEVKAADRALAVLRSEIALAQELAEARQAYRASEADAITTHMQGLQAEHAASLRAARDQIEAMDEEAQAQELAIKLNISLAEAVQRVTIAKLKLKQEGFWAGSEGWNALQDEIDAANRLADAMGGAERRRQNNEFWDSVESAAHNSFINIENGWDGTVEQMWKSIKTGLLEMIWSAFAKPLFLDLRAVLSGSGSLGGSAASVASGGGSALSLGSSLFGAGGMTGALTAGAGWLTGAASFGGIMGAAGSLIGTGTMAGISSGLAMGVGALAPILGPLALLAGSFKSLFGRTHEQHNLQGTFGGETGFEGSWHDYYKGGLFRSSKTVDTPLEDDFLQGLRTAWKTQEAAVIDYAKTLGLATDSIDGFTYSINLKLKDIDAKDESAYQQAVMERVNEAIRSGSNEMAQLLIGSWESVTSTVSRQVRSGGWEDDGGWSTVEDTITTQTYVASEFARTGEEAIDTLTRLATSLSGVNSVFDTLGYTLLSASLASGDLASSIADAFGGLETMGTATASYWQNYYSEEERTVTITRQLTEQLAALGLQMPTTRDGFRALVDAQDLTTESGRAAFAALINLSGAFAGIVPAAQTAAEALAAVQQALDDAVTAAQSRTDDVWSRLQDLLQEQIDAWQDIADEARSVFDTASSAARDIRGQVDSTRLWDAAQASVWIDQALAAARATGVLPDSSELSTAIGSARNLSMADYASVADYERDQLILAGRLDELGDIAGTQASFAEQQIDLMQRELEQWRTQIDVLRGIDLGIDTVAEAVTAIQQAIEAERAARAAAEAASDTSDTSDTSGSSTGKPSYSSGGYGSWGGGSGGVGSGGSYHSVPMQGFASSAEEAAAWAAQYAAIGDGHYYTYRHPNGGWTIGYGIYSGPAQLDLQQYAKGTEYVPYDMVAKIHQGERIIPAADNAAITRAMTQGGGSGDAALRAEVARLNTQVAELVAITRRQHDLLDQVTAGGSAMLTEAA